MAVAGVMPTAFAVTGVVGRPLLFVLVGAVLVLFSVGYAEMSRHVHNAGAFYAYIARGLGPTAGVGASLVALVSYSALQTGVYGIFGFEVSGLLAAYLDIELAWWIPAFAAVLVIGALGRLKTGPNTKVLGVLLVVEVVLVLTFDVATVGDPAGGGLSLHAFHPDTLAGAGVGAALCFCVAAFTGFEQAPVYAEETSRPQVVVSRTMFLAVGFVAVLFAFSSWAMTVAAGPSGVVGAAREDGPTLLFTLTEARLGTAFTDVLHVLFVTSVFVGLLSLHSVVARYAFAMGRERLLPAIFGRANDSAAAPATGSLLQSVVSVAAVLVFALTDDKPADDPTVPVLRLFTWTVSVGALGVTVLMATSCLAVIVFFVRRGAARSQAPRLAAAGLAGLALVGIAVWTVKDFDVLVGTGPGSLLSRLLPGIIGLALAGGTLYGLVLRFARPERQCDAEVGADGVDRDQRPGVRRDQAVHHGEPGRRRHADPHQRVVAALGDQQYHRDQQHDADPRRRAAAR